MADDLWSHLPSLGGSVGAYKELQGVAAFRGSGLGFGLGVLGWDPAFYFAMRATSSTRSPQAHTQGPSWLWPLEAAVQQLEV